MAWDSIRPRNSDLEKTDFIGLNIVIAIGTVVMVYTQIYTIGQMLVFGFLLFRWELPR